MEYSTFSGLVGEEWATVLKDYFNTKDLELIAGMIEAQRKQGKHIMPPKGSDKFFKVFKMLQPSQIKIVWINQDPYPQPGVMTGIALDCSESFTPQPSLVNVIKEIEAEYPENYVINRYDLHYLVEQGVFLVNTALSVEINNPGSHMTLWSVFTSAWIKALQNYNDKVWLLAGKQAQGFKSRITNPSHYIFETSHPSPLGATKPAPIPFLGSNCFIALNEQLSARNKKEIFW